MKSKCTQSENNNESILIKKNVIENVLQKIEYGKVKDGMIIASYDKKEEKIKIDTDSGVTILLDSDSIDKFGIANERMVEIPYDIFEKFIFDTIGCIGAVNCVNFCIITWYNSKKIIDKNSCENSNDWINQIEFVKPFETSKFQKINFSYIEHEDSVHRIEIQTICETPNTIYTDCVIPIKEKDEFQDGYEELLCITVIDKMPIFFKLTTKYGYFKINIRR